jgi:DHA2 family multidrug resistance protein
MTDNWKPKFSPWAIGLTVTLATFMEVLDTSIANVSLPHIAGNLSATVDESTWILTSYLVANAIILPISGWLSSLMGRKNYYMASVALFTISSALSGLAPNLFWLIVFRVFQGLAGGGLQPSEQAILVDSFPKEKLGMGMALYGFAVVTAPVIGPTLGGWITDNFSWRWIFYINIPVGIISLLLTSRIVEDPPYFKRASLKDGKTSFDWLGLTCVTLGIGALQIMLDKGQREDWFASHLIILLAVIAAVGLIGTFYWELRTAHPIVELRLLKDRNFFFSNIFMFMLGFALFGSTVLLPLFLQTLMGYPATTAGMVLSPGGLVTMATMPIVGFLLGKFDPRWLIAYGLAVVSFSLFVMSHFSLQISYTTAVTARMIQAAGLGFLFIPINTAAYAFVPREKNSSASGLLNFSRNLGGSFGIALATTFLTRSAQVHQNVLSTHTTPYDPAFMETINRLTRAFGAYLPFAGQAAGAARGTVYREMIRQATMLAYLDVFRVLGFLLLGIIPLLFLMKGIKPGKGPAAVH